MRDLTDARMLPHVRVNELLVRLAWNRAFAAQAQQIHERDKKR